MATAIEVCGPHTIKWSDSTGTGSKAVLGRGDNNDLFRIEVTNRYADIHTNEYGEMAAQSVLVGTTATVNFSLASFDRDEALKLQRRSGGNAVGTGLAASFPVVGALTNAGHGTPASDNTIYIDVDPDISSRIGIQVPRIQVVNLNFTDFGNKNTRLVFSGNVLPDFDTAGGGTFYTITTA
jgi:hypothetical protein